MKDFKITPWSKVSILGLKDFAPGKPLTLEVTTEDGTVHKMSVNHSFNEAQIEWFKAGSALNRMKQIKEKQHS